MTRTLCRRRRCVVIDRLNIPARRQLPANDRGRDFYVGDVHGEAALLWRLLEAVRFDPASDRLIAAGDLVDRGPDSPVLLEAVAANPWFHAVLGNHEAMLLASGDGAPATEALRRRWAGKGGAWFFELAPERQQQLRTLVTQLPLTLDVLQLEGPAVGVLHADLRDPGDWSALEDARLTTAAAFDERAESRSACALWGRRSARSVAREPAGDSVVPPAGVYTVDGLRLLVSGHTPMPAARPHRRGQRLFLDTGVYRDDGALSLWAAHSGQCWQIARGDSIVREVQVLSG